MELMTLVGKSHYYPLKEIVGPSYCYVHRYLALWYGMYTQFFSLFVSIYRYVCLFFGRQLISLNISPKVSQISFLSKTVFYGIL